MGKIIKYTCEKCGIKKIKQGFTKRGTPLPDPLICIRCQHNKKPTYELKYPEKRKAQKIARKLLREGNIKKESCCFLCKQEDKVMEMHHPDYSKPLEIIWLCQQCHGKLHGKK